MAAKWIPDNKGGTGGTVTISNDKPMVFEGLNEYQLDQVREIVREEIKAAIAQFLFKGAEADDEDTDAPR